MGSDRVSFALDAILRSYGQVSFSRSRLSGALLLSATFVAPAVGLAGLFGAVGSLGLALALGLDKAQIREGLLGYNGLLVGLVLGATVEASLPLYALLALGLVVLLIVQTALGGLLRLHLRLPALSLPFVAASWVLLAAVPYVGGVHWRGQPAGLLALPSFDVLAPLSRLGAVVAVPHPIAGLLVLLAVATWSRIALVHGALGLLCWALFDAALVDLPLGLDRQTLSFSFLFTPIALGGIFYLPGRASLLVALLGSLGAGLLAVGLGAVGASVGLPLLSLPFNLAALSTVYALSLRGPDRAPRPVLWAGFNPEDTLHRHRNAQRRFPGASRLPLRLPFDGVWTCTQGNDGPHTHQGAWRHGLDFEIFGPDGSKHQGRGDQVTDYHCYGQPVLALAAGTVAQVVDGLADNTPGELDTRNAWGNLVLVEHGPGLFSMLAHLQPRSIRVKPGDRVQAGQVLARCGASGRAPLPHLHVQLQATATVGDATLPLVFSEICREGAGACRIEAAALPVAGEAVRHPPVDAAIEGALRLAPGSRIRMVCTEDGRVCTQRVRSEVDALGARSLVDEETGARLHFDHGAGRFIAYDHQGPRRGGLFALYLALPRLPFVAGPLSWTDHLDGRRLRGSALDPLLDLMSLLRPPGDAPVHYQADDEGGDRVIRGEAPGLRTLALLRPIEGGLYLHIHLDERVWEVECTPC